MLKRILCLICHARGWWLFDGAIVICRHDPDCHNPGHYIERSK